MTQDVPKYHELMWPALTAFKQSGGSATVNELYELVAQNEGLTEEQQAVLAPNGRESMAQYRLRWALTYLKFIGAATNTTRGTWTATEHGGSVEQATMEEQLWAFRAERRKKRSARNAELESQGDEAIEADVSDESLDDGDEPGADGDWQDQLLGQLRSLSPGGFERLAQLLLREAGFENVVVTGKTGDGGIDGKGIYKVALMSFPMYFQCKRYTGSVRASEIRDFRGAMDGRGAHGLFITTGSFTNDARKEAAREGTKSVDLIEGTQLCDLLLRYGLGVSVEQRVVEDITIKSEFFNEYR